MWAKEYLPTPKVAQTLPLVLSRGKVEEVLEAIPNFKHRTIIMLIYSTGARVSGCVNVKLNNIDSRRMQVNIQEGKGLRQQVVTHEIGQQVTYLLPFFMAQLCLNF
ncbi:MAG: tyrosine-type recombinase/integrase [Bacteroidales bacterium]|nr:tyrosine-type recombinase/integrase [Bacteroidales bacterium]